MRRPYSASSACLDSPAGPVQGLVVHGASREQSRGRYAYVTVVDGMPLGAGVDIKTPRASFAELPRREIHLYASVVDWRTGHSGPTVYYLGVPETTPEFTTEAALETYLARPRSPGR